MFNQYILILVWIGFMALLQWRFCREEYNELTGEYEWRVTPFFSFMVILPVIWMAANRGWMADTSAYISSYRQMPDSFAEIPYYMDSVSKDKGFYLISVILRCILGYDFFPYLLVIAIFQGCIVAKFFRTHSINYVFSVFLFLASTDYISWMFNGIRQFTAVIIILLATSSILREKYARAIIMIIIASTFHQSALIMIPVIFIVQGEVWNRKTIAFIGAMLLAIAFVGRFTSFLDSALSGTQYVNVVSDYTAWDDDGTNPIRVLVYSVPAILAFIGRNKIKEVNDPLITISANMSIISMGLYLVSMVTSGVFLGRLPIYVSLFSYILLPWEIDNLFSGDTGRIVKMIAVLVYLGFYYYAMHFQNGLI